MGWKYQVGDKVRLRTDLVEGKCYGSGYRTFCYSGSMVKAFKPGDIVTITGTAHTRDYGYYVEGFEYSWWTEEMFEGLAEPEPEPEPEPQEPTDWFDYLF